LSAIFISYRREDAEDSARALYESLLREFGKERLFMDVENIEYGMDFREALEQKLDSCGVFLAIIGPTWLDARFPNDSSSPRRLDDPGDYVRQEVATALKRGADPADPRKKIPVVPVLVRGATMPPPEKLPDDLKSLAYRNALMLSHLDWDGTVQRLVNAIKPHVAAAERNVQPAVAASDTGAAARMAAIATASAAGGINKGVLIGVPALIVAVILGYFVLKPSPKRELIPKRDITTVTQPAASSNQIVQPTEAGQAGSPTRVPNRHFDDSQLLAVTIEPNAKFAGYPDRLYIDNKLVSDQLGVQRTPLELAPGKHDFEIADPKGKSCKGQFVVSADQTKFTPRWQNCQLQPVFNRQARNAGR
jgi:hypothetical protein